MVGHHLKRSHAIFNMKKLITLSFMSLMVAQAMAATPTQPSSLNFILSKSGAKVSTTFDAPGGMTGWVVNQGPGKSIVAYTPKNGDDVTIIGSIIGPNGQDLTAAQIEKYGDKVDYAKSIAQLEKSSYVIQGAANGKAKSTMYVFKDPNCGYCHLAYKALEPYTKAGLQIRWIPVAFLAPDSIVKAAGLLEAPDAQKALDDLHDNFGKKTATALPTPSQSSKEKVVRNTKLMGDLGFSGTPAMVMKTKDGKVIGVPGMFRLSDISKWTGIPAITNNDPMLQRWQ